MLLRKLQGPTNDKMHRQFIYLKIFILKEVANNFQEFLSLLPLKNYNWEEKFRKMRITGIFKKGYVTSPVKIFSKTFQSLF